MISVGYTKSQWHSPQPPNPDAQITAPPQFHVQVQALPLFPSLGFLGIQEVRFNAKIRGNRAIRVATAKDPSNNGMFTAQIDLTSCGFHSGDQVELSYDVLSSHSWFIHQKPSRPLLIQIAYM